MALVDPKMYVHKVMWLLPEVSRVIIVYACFYFALADLDMLRGSYRVLADEWVQGEERLKLKEASEFWILYTGCFRREGHCFAR